MRTTNGGVWPAMVGIAMPLPSFATHVELDVSQNCVAVQFASVVQPAGAAHLLRFVATDDAGELIGGYSIIVA